MKKAVLLSLVLVTLVGAAAVAINFWRRLATPSIRPDELVPGETLLLVEAVDLARSALRGQGTELFKLWNEPEVQAFLEKPLATHPALKGAGQLQKQLVKLWPRQVFAAVVSLEGTNPKMLGGFSYVGDGRVAEQWLAEPRRKMKDAHPAGHAEVSLYGKIEIETYMDKDFVLAEATHAGWHLLANDLGLLKEALDRLDGAPLPAGRPRLAQDADYQKAFAALPAEADVRVFARTGSFLDQMQAAVAAGDPAKITGLEGLRQVRALAAVSKIESRQFHDAVFAMSQSETKPEPLARGALELTNLQTAGFYSAQIGTLGFAALPAEMQSAVPFLSTLESALKAQGAKLVDLPAIFGPEVSVILPKPRGSVVGTLVFDVRDAGRANQLLAALQSPDLGDAAWTADDEDGVAILTGPPSDGVISLVPLLAATDRYWFLGLSATNLVALAKPEAGAPRLDQAPAYRALAAQVIAPTNAFGYFDLGALAESYYATLRPLVALGLVGSEESGQYFDAGQLPNGATLSRHLGSLMTSHSAVAGGSLWEARGNISVGQALLAGAAAYRLSGAAWPSLPKPAAPAGK